MPHTPPPASDDDAPPLRRSLRVVDVTFLVMGGIVGAGIFRTPHDVAVQQPTLWGILAVWALGGLLALCGATVFAELGGLFPNTGGQYVFLRNAFGRTVAFLQGWSLLSLIVSGAISIVASVCVEHLDLVVAALLARSEGVLSPGWQRLIACLLIAAFAWINVRGVRLGANLHNVIMVLKVAGILFVVVLGSATFFDAGHPSGLASGSAGIDLGTLALAALAVLFSYGGCHNAAAIAGEIQDPARVLPRAILIGTTTVIALYLLLNLALVQVLGIEELTRTSTPVAAAAERMCPGWGGLLVASMVVVSTLGITHALMLMSPRVSFAMACDGLFLSACARTHPVHRTPHVAIALQAAFAIAHQLLWEVGPLLGSLVFVDWVFFTLVGLAYFRFRRTLPDHPRPYRGTLHPWPQLVFVALSGAVVVATLVDFRPEVLVLPGSLFLLGIAAHLLAPRFRRDRRAP